MRGSGEFRIQLPLVNAESGVNGDLISIIMVYYKECLIWSAGSATLGFEASEGQRHATDH